MPVVHLDESVDLIDICRDNVFKAVFTRESPESHRALSSLVSAIIGRDVDVLTITANEPPGDSLQDRQIRFDVNCRTTLERDLLNIEMSINPNHCEPVRMEFYAGKLFTSQNIRGKNKTYQDLKMAYQIAFLVNRRFFDDEEYLHCFEYYDSERQVKLGGRSRIITVELAKLERTAEKAVGEMTKSEMWAVYFRYITDKSMRDKINTIIHNEEGIAMASQVLATISRDERERARLMSEFKFEIDTQSRIEQGRRDGLREGKREGLRKGRLEGRREGRLAGRQEGVWEGKVEIAKILKGMGESVGKITRVTGLSPEEVAAL